MSISFHGAHFGESLDVSNGMGFRMLKAIGAPDTGETAGELPIEEAKEGLCRARREAEDIETLRYCWHLDEIVNALIAAGSPGLRWS